MAFLSIMSDLTPSKIKDMTQRQREKLKAEDLLSVIMNYQPESSVQITKLTESIDALSKTIHDLCRETRENSSKIVELNVSNIKLNKEIESLKEEISANKKQIERAEQYSRINNVEIVGLNSDGKSDEDAVLNFFSTVLDVSVDKNEIDACHQIPSKRKDCKMLKFVNLSLENQKQKSLTPKRI